MCLQGFDVISTNIEILIYIFKQLKLEDQLRLAQVSDELSNIFECYFWKETYSSLIINRNEEDFVVCNKSGINRISMKPEVFKEFLRFQSDKVRALTERRGIRIDVRPFRYLTSLSYRNMQVPIEHLQYVADNCPHLESIHLYCCSDEEQEYIVVGKNWNIETVLKMKNLKSLSLENSIRVFVDYRDFRKLVTKLNLEYLLLKAYLEPEQEFIEEDNSSPTIVKLKELEIETTFHPEAYCANMPTYMSNFQNLVKLTVKSIDYITDEILANMAEACQNLEMLYIQFSGFEDMHTFAIPSKLKELSLNDCYGLTQDNLKYMLTQLKITKFSSVTIKYEGEFEDFRISPSIQTLEFDGVHTHKFKLAYEGNENLKDLTWYDEFYIYDETSIATDVPLDKCINLETLNMKAGFMPRDTLLQLKSLHKLTIPQSMPRLNWQYITAVLKHSPLHEFVMNDYCTASYLKDATDVPDSGFTTNVKIIKITLEVFAMAFDFWVDIFAQNEYMKLTIANFQRNGDFLKRLINHKKFPRNIKRLDACCFNLSCIDLRKNFDATMEKLRRDTDHVRHEYDEDLYRLILCRK